MLRLLTDEEVARVYGDIFKQMGPDGSPVPSWSQSILTSFRLPAPLPVIGGGKALNVTCHKLVQPPMEKAFQTIYRFPEAWNSIGDYGGCYLFRRNRNNPRALSRHSWGIAIDLDVTDNPNGSPGHMHPLIIQAFYDNGFYWGGWYSGTKDPMHFEAACSI